MFIFAELLPNRHVVGCVHRGVAEQTISVLPSGAYRSLCVSQVLRQIYYVLYKVFITHSFVKVSDFEFNLPECPFLSPY